MITIHLFLPTIGIFTIFLVRNIAIKGGNDPNDKWNQILYFYIQILFISSTIVKRNNAEFALITEAQEYEAKGVAPKAH